MKLVKIRFTEWRDHPAEHRSPIFQQQLDEWNTRISVLTAAIARMKDEQAHSDNETLRQSIARATADLEKIDAERTMLLEVESNAAKQGQEAARRHRRAGTFGYQVLNDAGTVEKIVDAAGAELPVGAVYSSLVVDLAPPLPAWAKKQKR